MKPEEFAQYIKCYNEDVFSTLIRKGNDYAEDRDILSYAKTSSEVCKILGVDVTNKYGVIIFLIVHKIIRLCNLMFNAIEVENESIEDTIRDIVGYCYLLRGLIAEQEA